jgi:hypothetical protein
MPRNTPVSTTRIVARYLDKRASLPPTAKGTVRVGDSDGSYMSVQNLESLRDHSAALLERVGAQTALPDWVEAKIDRAAANLLDVMEYMAHGEGALPPNQRGY